MYSVYSQEIDGDLSNDMSQNQELWEFLKKILLLLMKQAFLNLHKIAITFFADAVIVGSEKLDKELELFIQKSDKQTLDYQSEDVYIAAYNALYDELLEEKQFYRK